MFSALPPFFNFQNNAQTQQDAPMFAGVPLVNPLLNDAQTNLKTLDERIAQLESVAQWLNMNLQMVNSSVQQLQVQKQTLQALADWQKISKDALDQFNSMGEAEKPSKTKKTGTAKTESTQSETPSAFDQMAQAWWMGLQNQFAQLAQPIVEEAKPATPTKTTRPRKPKTL